MTGEATIVVGDDQRTDTYADIYEKAKGLSRNFIGENISILRVKILKGTNLAKKDIFGLSDPYCVIKLFDRRRANLVTKLQTNVQKKTLNPQWNCSFYLRVNTLNHKLLLELFDENRITRDDFLGEVEIPLNNLPNEGNEQDIERVATKDYILQQRSAKSHVRGNIRVYIAVVKKPENQDTADGVGILRVVNDLSRLGASSVDILNESSCEVVPHGINDESFIESDYELNTTLESAPLPPGWEERQDANGRTFYVDHANRTTTWNRPGDSSHPVSSASVYTNQGNRFNVRKHISLEETLPEASCSSNTDLPPGWEERKNIQGRNLYIDHNTRKTTWTKPNPNVTLNDQNEQSQGAENSERLHPDVPSQAESPLPPGWAMQLAPNNRVFFINHNQRITSWSDPRTNIENNINKDQEPLPAGWEERVHIDGRVFFIDHETQSTQWEDPRLQTKDKRKIENLPYSRDYKRKYDFFRSRLKKPENVPSKYEIHVRRNNLFQDSYRFVLHSCTNVELLKTKLWIVFDGETGLDYGGVAREWFYLLSKEMFNPYYGLFEYSATDNYTLQINSNSGIANEQHLSYFTFIGRVAGMAVYHGKLLDAFFIRPFYKMMLGKKITLKDMESVDSEYHESLNWLLSHDPTELDVMFVLDYESFGTIVSKELITNGANIPVTNENKKQYIDLVIKWRFMDRVSEQMNAFMKGFEDIIPRTAIQVFDERELEYLLCGLGEIDMEDWRKNTQYRSGYHDKHVVIQWFWKAVQTFDDEMKARLLQFVTGTSRVPMNGFAELYGSNGPQKFTIERWGNTHQLPRSHTCFNRIDLPPYHSYHELREKLRLAIENTEGFEGVD
ncbi:E3 ubiquitin-protein ligase NEDD4 isoform X1 [Hydra vulgaris]|uniref:E3 ubiquitin-protein ligase NEDD4 isoform X1 n=1 Tax=Hydra vulgaris TaxID=6087 RepID=UPI000640FC6F|nr:E3 ubiquitin-protein ligase NEDD4 isoform X1 [Hydra vulgaris]